MTANRIRIQNFLVDLAKSAEFHAVEYADGRARISEQSLVPMASCLCNEVSSDFSRDESYGRLEVLKRTRWSFELRIEFGREVSLELFETALCSNVPRVAHDPDTELKGFAVRLVKVFADHPVQQGPQTGTQARFLFDVELNRN